MKVKSWLTCAGCGYRIKREWSACPKCDANLGLDIWNSFCKKNKLYAKGVLAGIPKKKAIK
jgi:hypothetical protein